ncbi:hypothetical protein TRFO_07567 [Tritrichomonas foetus]|uniref:Uncharacterized protein n=1 Tax=Tritrichomonas foetus TaxID=1144522 RepID=A0A1J4JRG2_9EUKA|nr:hypothetical protein TRFO_07567 [Tritrichomonas foetus]|eukprot:OHT01338.1 hypothetical protein TRFO_07567 [Tritrichomonas foetus]
MLISSSDDFSSSLLKEFAKSTTILQCRYSKNQNNLVLDPILYQIIEILDSQTFLQRDVYKIQKVFPSNNQVDLLRILHSLINNPNLNIRGNAVLTLSVIMKKEGIDFSDAFGPNESEVAEFYANYLFNCADFEMLPLSIINSIIYDKYENIRNKLIQLGLPVLLLETECDLISPLLVSFCRNLPIMPEEFLHQFILRLVSLVSSSKIATCSDVMESILILIEKGIPISLNDPKAFEKEIMINLYTEDVRCITLAIKLLIKFNIFPVNHLGMLLTFVESHVTKLGVVSIQCFRHFSNLIIASPFFEETKNTLMCSLDNQSFRVVFECLLTLSNFPLSADEKVHFLETLIVFLNDNEIQEICLTLILKLLQNSDQSDQIYLKNTIHQEMELIEDLIWSEEQNVAQTAQEIFTLIEGD